jgi:hypothetical protein
MACTTVTFATNAVLLLGQGLFVHESSFRKTTAKKQQGDPSTMHLLCMTKVQAGRYNISCLACVVGSTARAINNDSHMKTESDIQN